ncbi:helix-turn-helix domain-containing protein [Streptomyces dysideae]|uniref:DNA-binding protein n=1 Tax=Streptomyces dysideae TaxID=909626 RepID=A0A101UTT5_9ACTN|nr:helix-turn-helix domain-containing protein [Streptomyces dysideae]KUO16726.1 DNA-binding protein [Streptomyces dysideae]
MQKNSESLGELLRLMRRSELPREVLAWLERRIGADAAWVGRGAVVQAATGRFPTEVMGGLREQLERLTDGRLAAATIRVGAREVHLEAFGPRAPRPVLVTVGASALSRESAALASHVGTLLELRGRASKADSHLRGYEDKARQLRFAVLTALMTGDLTLARRMTTGDVPSLLSAERVRVYLLSCPDADRDRLARVHLDSSGYHGSGLMVHCPAFKEHLICPIAEDAEPGGRPEQAEVLRRLVRDNSGYALGISRPHPLTSTAAAYGEALHALAVARNSPRRLAAYSGRPSLVHLLPRPEALAWAAAFLAPLHDLPTITVDVTRLAVTFPRSAVARLLHLSRTTVAAHCRRAEEALGVDFGAVRTRAAVDLALSLSGLQSVPARFSHRAPNLEELLRTPPATAWAETFLHPLHAARPATLHVTASAWIDADTDARRTAARLGLSRNTVRAHLRAAESLLNRDLLTTGSGIHDLVHALSVTGGHPDPALPADAFSRSS